MRPEYPRSLHEFRKLFSDEAACRLYLARSRWPEGFQCPRCQQGEALELPTRLLWRCRACRHDTSVTAGTVLHRTRIPLTQWFWAAFQTLLGLGSQQQPTTYKQLYQVELNG